MDIAMNQLKTIIVLLTLALATAKCQLPPARFNFLLKTNERAQDIVNKIFETLSLSANFINSNKIKLLLNMHDTIIDIAEKNYETYKSIFNTTRTHGKVKEKAVFNITHIVKKICEIWRPILPDNIVRKRRLKNEKVNKMDGRSIDISKVVTTFVNRLDIKSLNQINVFLNKSEHLVNIQAYLRNRLNNFAHTLKPWGDSNSTESLKSNLTNRRLYSGIKSDIETYPFMASFHMLGKFICSGSIISAHHIITAASCLQMPYISPEYSENPDNLKARVSSKYTDKKGKEITISNVHFHPKYDPMYLRENLALAELKTQLAFGLFKKVLRRIEYDNVGEPISDGTTISVLGWGEKGEYYGDNNELISVAYIQIYKLDDCKVIYSPIYVNDHNFCVGYQAISSGACKRDVGGPGIIGRKLVGVVSFGPPVCGTPNAPTVFSKISHYAPWIDNIVQSYDTTMKTKTDSIQQTKNSKDIFKGVEILQTLLEELLERNEDLNDNLEDGQTEPNLEKNSYENSYATLYTVSPAANILQEEISNVKRAINIEDMDFQIKQNESVADLVADFSIKELVDMGNNLETVISNKQKTSTQDTQKLHENYYELEDSNNYEWKYKNNEESNEQYEDRNILKTTKVSRRILKKHIQYFMERDLRNHKTIKYHTHKYTGESANRLVSTTTKDTIFISKKKVPYMKKYT